MRFGPVVLACWIVGCGPPQTVNRVSSERGSGGAGGTRMDARAGSGGAGSLVAGGSGGSTGGAVGTGGADGVGGAAGLGGSSGPEAGTGIDNPGPTGGTGGNGGTGPIDAAMEPTSSPMPDAALPPPDTAPPPDAPPMMVCPMPAADEGISSFEGGLTSDRVGDRGGTPWTVLAGTLDPAMGITGTLAPATAPARCGSTTFLRFTGMSSATRTPITRTLFRNPSGSTAQFFNASAFKGFRMFLRSTVGGTVRIKLPDRNTALPGGVCMTCNDHFIIDLNVTAEWQLFTVAFAQLKQLGTGDPQPALASGALYSLEIVAPRGGPSAAPFTLEVDDISFFR